VDFFDYINHYSYLCNMNKTPELKVITKLLKRQFPFILDVVGYSEIGLYDEVLRFRTLVTHEHFLEIMYDKNLSHNLLTQLNNDKLLGWIISSNKDYYVEYKEYEFDFVFEPIKNSLYSKFNNKKTFTIFDEGF
jgi:hypothetical protein